MILLTPEEYQPKIRVIYESLKQRLLAVLPSVEVEHIGASSIRGAISKGDLDILVRVQKEEFNEALSKIESLGFSIKIGTLRTDSLCMLETREFQEDVAVQLIEAGSQFENFIVFRDRLNADADLVVEYNKVKLSASHLSEDE